MKVDKNKLLDWQVSKKLLSGSLVVLSDDKFETMVCGIIMERNAKALNEQ